MMALLKFIQMAWRMITRYAPVTHYMAVSQAKNEFAGTFGGVIWWIAEPLIYSLIFYFLFGVVFETRSPEFISFLLVGLTVWRWFSRTVRSGGNAVNGNTGLMRKLDIPKMIFPIQAVIVETYKFLVALFLICCLLAAVGDFNLTTIYYFPIVLFSSCVVFLGISLLVSAIMPFFPDLKKIIGLSFRGLLFISGVLFEADRVPVEYHTYYYLNPLVTLIESMRDVLYFGRVPDLQHLGYVTLAGGVLCLIGAIVHIRYNRVFARYLI